MVKKITVNDKKLRELEGFEDVLDLLTDEKTIATKESKAQSEDSYELYSFLENENHRLKSIDGLLSIKLESQKRFPQLPGLITEQEKYLERLKDQAIDSLLPADSSMNLHISMMFNKLFKKNG